jgi:predicted small lipoprotein YifL
MNTPEKEKDIFNTKWVIFAVIVASLLIPLLTGCGVKGDLKHPKQQTEKK